MDIISYVLAIFFVIIFLIGPILMALFILSMIAVFFMIAKEGLKNLLQARK